MINWNEFMYHTVLENLGKTSPAFRNRHENKIQAMHEAHKTWQSARTDFAEKNNGYTLNKAVKAYRELEMAYQKVSELTVEHLNTIQNQ